MKRTTRIALLAAGAVALGLTTTLVSAHGGGYGPGYGHGQGWGMGPGMMGGGPGWGGMGPGMMGGGPGWGGMGPGMMGGGAGWAGMGPGAAGAGPCAAQGADAEAVLEPRLAAMKAQLKISAEQDAAWQAYATQMKTQFQSMQAWRATMHAGTPATAAERTELHSAMLKQRAQVAEATSQAFKGLYDVLTPEQRAVVDQGPFAMGPGYGRGPGGRYR